MSDIKFTCPYCHHGVAAPSDKVGKRGTCPYCHNSVLVRPPLPKAEPLCDHAQALSRECARPTDQHDLNTATNGADSRWPRVALVSGSCLLLLVVLSVLVYSGSGSEASDDSPLAQTDHEDKQIIKVKSSEITGNGNSTDSIAAKKPEHRSSPSKKQAIQGRDEFADSKRNNNNQTGKISELEKSIEALERAMTDELDLDQRGKIISLRSTLLAKKEPISVPSADRDVLWVSSVPPGADVWCAYRSEIECDLKWSFLVQFKPPGSQGTQERGDNVSAPFKARHYRGKTPLIMEALPGRYLVGVGLPISKKYGNEGLKAFPYLPSEARETIVSASGTLVAYTRNFSIEKQEKKLAIISTLFCPQSIEYSTFAAAFPEGNNFALDEREMRARLDEINQGRWDGETISADQVQSVLDSLRRSGTAFWPAKKDNTFFIAGLRGYDSLTLARAKNHSNAGILSLPSIPPVPPISLPKFTVPPPKIDLPTIKIPQPKINLPPPTINLPPSINIPNLNKSPLVSPPSKGRRAQQDRTHSHDTSASKRAMYQQKKASEQLKLADKYIRAGKLVSGKKRLETLIKNYPETPAARQAKFKLDQLE